MYTPCMGVRDTYGIERERERKRERRGRKKKERGRERKYTRVE